MALGVSKGRREIYKGRKENSGRCSKYMQKVPMAHLRPGVSYLHELYWWTDFPSKCVRSVAKLCLTHCDPMTAVHQASLSITNSQSLLKLMSITSVMLSNRLFLRHPPLLHPQFFPASGSFPMRQFFASGSQSFGVSALASVLLMNISIVTTV